MPWGLLLAFAVSLPLLAAVPRFARVALADGPVHVEAGGRRFPAERNLSLGEGSRIETGAAARAEIALDDGNTLRLGPNSLAEFSDLTRLSTGQRITLISLRRGTLDATAEPAGLDAFVLVAPGMELTFENAARVSLEAGKTSSVEVVQGRVRFSSRTAELELREGQGARVDPQADERFELIGGGRIRIQPITDQSYLGAALAQTSGDIRVVGEEPPPQITPLPEPEGPTYYYQPAPPEPPPAPLPPEPVYYPVYVPQPVPVPVPEVVVVEPDPPRHSPPPGGSPHTPPQNPRAAPPPQPPPPKVEPPPAKEEGPEHRSRLRSPEGEASVRRR